MERLTNREENILTECSDCCELAICLHDVICEEVDNAIGRLRAYENLEEQGLLIKLPCKVGTTVYCIMTSIKGTNPMIFTQSFDYSMVECFGKTVFLSKEEAEAKLKEIEGE